MFPLSAHPSQCVWQCSQQGVTDFVKEQQGELISLVG